MQTYIKKTLIKLITIWIIIQDWQNKIKKITTKKKTKSNRLFINNIDKKWINQNYILNTCYTI